MKLTMFTKGESNAVIGLIDLSLPINNKFTKVTIAILKNEKLPENVDTIYDDWGPVVPDAKKESTQTNRSKTCTRE